MKFKLQPTSFSKGVLAVAAAVVTMTAGIAAHAQDPKQPRYTVVDLGVLGTGNNSGAFDLNNLGWIAGSSNLTPGGPQHAFLWFGGGPLRDLGTLGGPNSAADGPNWFGEAPIISEIAKTDPDGEDFCGYGTHLQCRAAVYQFGKLTALRGLPGGRNAVSIGINNLGQVVGWAENGVHDLGTLGDANNTMFNAASSINDLGDVVGTSQFTDGTVHSFLWTRDAGIRDLGTLLGAFATIAGCCHTINNRDEVVGFSIDGNGSTAFVWKGKVITDLNTLIPTNSPLHLLNAESLNDAGEIVGQGCVMPTCTEFHAYRAIPKWR